ncbi:hypothetical protein [Candidatus Deianiraea vastatrix]|uniref:Uncharacterized protein n=1 Tax=Candidatus Deianiraea vastatrix TaxID=2163644 RepID=A0A5B8XJ15_9RICK|nr:hypothetical protein [Candidatus Deianiraea vastatrix]QED23941.1 hypothetical protein Deia_01164 [Candidatus Deianiraea vastatrix]
MNKFWVILAAPIIIILSPFILLYNLLSGQKGMSADEVHDSHNNQKMKQNGSELVFDMQKAFDKMKNGEQKLISIPGHFLVIAKDENGAKHIMDNGGFVIKPLYNLKGIQYTSFNTNKSCGETAAAIANALENTVNKGNGIIDVAKIAANIGVGYKIERPLTKNEACALKQTKYEYKEESQNKESKVKITNQKEVNLHVYKQAVKIVKDANLKENSDIKSNSKVTKQNAVGH